MAQWGMGAKAPTDVIWTGIAAPLLISDRLVELLGTLGARGWSTYKVHLSGKSGERIAGYSGLSVHGRCGSIDSQRSVTFDKIMPGGVFRWWRGLYFDPATWDGSHLFMPSGRAGWIFVVDEVREALEKAKVKNVDFRRLDLTERTETEMNMSLKA